MISIDQVGAGGCPEDGGQRLDPSFFPFLPRQQFHPIIYLCPGACRPGDQEPGPESPMVGSTLSHLHTVGDSEETLKQSTQQEQSPILWLS